jgi:hypothetical protein
VVSPELASPVSFDHDEPYEFDGPIVAFECSICGHTNIATHRTTF